MKSRAPFPPGVITLCVVFISLCMALLALLTYSGARNELALAQTSAENIQAILGSYRWHFNAWNDVSKVLSADDPADLSAPIRGDPYWKWTIADGIMSCDFPLIHAGDPETGSYADEGRVLRVEIALEPTPRLISERIVYVGDWTPDQSLDVWDGQ